MQTQRWWLSDSNGWGEDLIGPDKTTVNVDFRGLRATASGLVLDIARDSLLHPRSRVPTVGSTTLPPPVAAGGHDIFLATPGCILKQFDSASGAMVDRFALHGTIPGGADRFAIDLLGRLVLAATLDSRVLLALHRDAGITYDRRTLPPGRHIIDVRVADSGLFILAECKRSGESHFEVWLWKPGRPLLQRRAVVIDRRAAGLAHGRLLVGLCGELYIFDPHRPSPNAAGTNAALARLSELRRADPSVWKPFVAVRDDLESIAFPVEPHETGSMWRLRIPPHGQHWKAGEPVPPKWLAFDARGQVLTIEDHEPSAPPPYVVRGTAEIGPLDGGANRMGWDCVQLDLTELPVGSVIELSTRTSDEPEATPYPEREWSHPHRRIGPVSSRTSASSPSTEMDAVAQPRAAQVTPLPSLPEGDFAVLSAPGRYLWMRIHLLGGSTTPRVRGITVNYARRGLVDYLPGVFREADRETRFLERFLAALESVWEPIESALNDLDRELRPETARPAMVSYLAEWFVEPLADEWGLTQRRRAVSGAVERRPRRGTPEAVQQALKVFLANRWSIAPDELGTAVPFVWEHFRSRNFVRTPADGRASDRSGTLFGAEILRRLRIGRTALGEGVLRDLPPADRSAEDPVYLDAHRYSVFVPASLVPTEHALHGMQDVMRREAPAHTIGCIEPVHPRLLVGRQATLGVDTVVGVYPRARLANAATDQQTRPGYFLDYDALIAEADSEAWTPRPMLGSHDSYLPWELA